MNQKDKELLLGWLDAIDHIIHISNIDQTRELPEFDDYLSKDFDSALEEFEPDKNSQHLYRLSIVSQLIREKINEFDQQRVEMNEFYTQNPDLRVTAFDIVDTIKL